MLRIKFFAMTLVLGLTGVVYAAGNMQDAAHHNHGAQSADKAPACCQAGHKKDAQKDAQKDGEKAAMSCDREGGGCCKSHSADGKQASAKAEGESCCAGGGGACCKSHQKAGADAAVVKTSADADAADCCGAGASCCKDGAACCKGHKAGAQTAATDKKHEGGCDCCGTSCAMHAGR
jgi:hypothetical protein